MPDTTPDVPTRAITYTVHPFRHDLARGMVVITIILLAAWGAAATTGRLLFAHLAVLVLTASLARYFFPTTYALTAEGITVRNLLVQRRRAWREFRRFRATRGAFVLFTRSRPSRLDHYRGMTIAAGPDRRAVLASLRARLREVGTGDRHPHPARPSRRRTDRPDQAAATAPEIAP